MASMLTSQKWMSGYSLATRRAASSIRPPVSRRTLGFSTRVTDFLPFLRANSKAARTMRAQADLVMMRVETAMSSAGTSLKRFILVCVRRASRTIGGKGWNSTPEYIPSVFSRKMTRSMPSLKFNGFPA